MDSAPWTVPFPSPRSASTPPAGASAVPQPTLFEPNPPRLLRLGKVMALFIDRLDITETGWYESFRPWLPVVLTRMVPVRGEKGRYRAGSPRVREDVARELVEIAAAGRWRAYCEGEMATTHPHLYGKTSAVR